MGVTRLRSDVENELGPVENAYLAAPDDDNNRRAYAGTLFKLGNMWQANEIMAPLATSSALNTDDLRLGARIALLLSDYNRASTLFERLGRVADNGSEIHTKALEGLAMVDYQANRYSKSRELRLPDQGDLRGRGTLLTFMQRFEGEPYQIEWATPEKVAHLPIINDFTPPGALPRMRLEINGFPMEFILDTGGNMLYVDEAIAQKVGIRSITRREARYAYTKGEYVSESLGVADTVKMGNVTLKNVPTTVAKWKVMGLDSDGVVTTQVLKQFLSTVDYENRRLTFRERSQSGRRQLLDSFGGEEPQEAPFFMADTHAMFTKGTLNGRPGLNMLMDSGLAASTPLVIPNETVEFLGIGRNAIQGTRFYWSPIESYGISTLLRGPTQALGNVIVEENTYWSFGFLFDALVSHQYLRHLGSWTIDFDTMTYYFSVALAGRRVNEDPSKIQSWWNGKRVRTPSS